MAEPILPETPDLTQRTFDIIDQTKEQLAAADVVGRFLALSDSTQKQLLVVLEYLLAVEVRR